MATICSTTSVMTELSTCVSQTMTLRGHGHSTS
uniref:Uncharacterized protein n=1 Tax=Anguilla anguilla TaxID=7936 RepID=A0A0E9U9N0_ANGAN